MNPIRRFALAWLCAAHVMAAAEPAATPGLSEQAHHPRLPVARRRYNRPVHARTRADRLEVRHACGRES